MLSSSFLLRLLLIAMLVLNGAWSAFASVGMNPAMEDQPSKGPAVVQGDEDCMAHHGQMHRAGASGLEKADVGHGDHASPDCCKSSGCACVHACASALPAYVYVSVHPALGLRVMPLSLGRPAPVLPQLIRPPIG